MGLFLLFWSFIKAKIARFARMFLIVSKYLLPKGFSGLTVYPFVFLRHRHQAQDAVIIRHEKIHIQQQLELLVLPFFAWYAVEFLYRLIQYRDRKLAYYNISFEREAYQHEKDPGYLKRRSLWAFFKYC